MLIAYPNLSLCLPKNIFYQKNIKLEKKCPLQANKRKLWGKCDFIKNIFTPVFRERKYLTKYSPVHSPPPSTIWKMIPLHLTSSAWLTIFSRNGTSFISSLSDLSTNQDSIGIPFSSW